MSFDHIAFYALAADGHRQALSHFLTPSIKQALEWCWKQNQFLLHFFVFVFLGYAFALVDTGSC